MGNINWFSHVNLWNRTCATVVIVIGCINIESCSLHTDWYLKIYFLVRENRIRLKPLHWTDLGWRTIIRLCTHLANCRGH